MILKLEFEAPTWEQLYELLLRLADRIRLDDFKPDIIVGVSRGGWPPACVLSDLLDYPELANVKTEFYLGLAKTKTDPVITQSVSASVRGKKVLLVDDVADTGKTLGVVQSHLREQGALLSKSTTIYYKPWSMMVPDWYAIETKLWIIFPWEIKETVKELLASGMSVEKIRAVLVGAGLQERLILRFIREIQGKSRLKTDRS